METSKLSIADLLQQDDNSATAGFVWESGKVQYDPHKNRQKVDLGQAPHVKVVDVAKFEQNFPGVILAALNGTSIKVACQAVTRRMLLRDRKSAWKDMQTSVLNSLRGIKSRAAVVVRTEIKWGGKTFATVEEAATFMRESLTAKGLDSDTVELIVLDAFPELAEEEDVEEITEE
jgi:hypothetical protein